MELIFPISLEKLKPSLQALAICKDEKQFQSLSDLQITSALVCLGLVQFLIEDNKEVQILREEDTPKNTIEVLYQLLWRHPKKVSSAFLWALENCRPIRFSLESDQVWEDLLWLINLSALCDATLSMLPWDKNGQCLLSVTDKPQFLSDWAEVFSFRDSLTQHLVLQFLHCVLGHPRSSQLGAVCSENSQIWLKLTEFRETLHLLCRPQIIGFRSSSYYKTHFQGKEHPTFNSLLNGCVAILENGRIFT